MAASEVFKFDRGDSATVDYATPTHVLLAGEVVRVRFTEQVGAFQTRLAVTRNGVKSFITIDDYDVWQSEIAEEGDTVGLVASLTRSAVVAGVIETLQDTAGTQSSATATVTSVASAAASTTIKAANTARKGLSISNTDANMLYLLLGGGAASATNFTVAISAATSTAIGYYEVPYGFTGAITGFWAADGTGAALVTEYT